MKKILSIFALALFALSATGQTTIIDFAEVWAEKQHQIRLEVAIHATAANILDTPADSIFAAIRDGDVLESLSLSNCGMQACAWAPRLRIMTSLSRLGLARNKIDNRGFQNLCDGLQETACLRELDVR